MIFSLSVLAAAAAVAASPLAPRTDRYPPTSAARAFTLVVNVTDPSRDFSPSINHWVVTGAHSGAGTESSYAAPDGGRVFYQNGTASDLHSGGRDGNLNVIFDGGLYPFTTTITRLGVGLPDADYLEHVGSRIGATPDVVQSPIFLRQPPVPFPRLSAGSLGTFAVCRELNPVSGRPDFALRFANTTRLPDGSRTKVPDYCVSVALLARCDVLQPVPEGAYFDHKFAAEVQCYQDVATIDWTKYESWADSTS